MYDFYVSSEIRIVTFDIPFMFFKPMKLKQVVAIYILANY